MSVIEQLEQKLNRVIKSATDHARFSGRLNEDLAAIESKVAGLIEAARLSVAAEIESKLKAMRAELLGEAAAVSSESADALDRTVGALTAGRSTAPGDDRRIDPNTGLPVEP